MHTGKKTSAIVVAVLSSGVMTVSAFAQPAPGPSGAPSCAPVSARDVDQAVLILAGESHAVCPSLGRRAVYETGPYSPELLFPLSSLFGLDSESPQPRTTTPTSGTTLSPSSRSGSDNKQIRAVSNLTSYGGRQYDLTTDGGRCDS